MVAVPALKIVVQILDTATTRRKINSKKSSFVGMGKGDVYYEHSNNRLKKVF